MGNETVKIKSKTRERNGKKQKYLDYTFEREFCRNCPRRCECIGKSKRIAKLMTISINTPELYEYSQRAKTSDFVEELPKASEDRTQERRTK